MADSQNVLWPDKKVFCVVTGASRGIGQCLALELAKRLQDNLVMAIVARSQNELDDTKTEASKYVPQDQIFTASVDLSSLQAGYLNLFLMQELQDLGVEVDSFDCALLVCNAGSLGDLSEQALSMTSYEKWQDYLALNLMSCPIIVSDFLNLFEDDNNKVSKYVVNITSLLALEPRPSLGYYCVGKAAREMYFKVVAEENKDIRVLNYSPGPVQTSMISEILNKCTSDKVKEEFKSMTERNVLLQPEQTVKRALQILREDRYKSGQHVDYFDTDI